MTSKDHTNLMVDHLTAMYRSARPWRNFFADKFGSASDEEWTQALIHSQNVHELEECYFPLYPENALQCHVHGHGGDGAIRGAMMFRNFTRYHAPQGIFTRPNRTFLDYGCGYGRISRTFMRDFPLENMFGFEPDKRLAAIARALNPYITVVSGDHMPPTLFPAETFDLIVGFSVFSHLSPHVASAWLHEFNRILRPGGCLSITTWGIRFIDRLIEEQAARNKGETIHFYSDLVINNAGDLHDAKRRYNSGEFVYVNSCNSDKYGEAFVPFRAMRELLPASLRILEHDTSKVQQDVYLVVKA